MNKPNDTQTTLRAVKLRAAEGNLPEAEKLLRDCLRHVEEKYGRKSLDAAYLSSELATLLERQGKQEESLEYARMVRNILLEEVRAIRPNLSLE
jgi:hypothetical protein